MLNKYLRHAAVAALAVGALWLPAHASIAGPFDQGNVRISVGGGLGRGFDQTYFIVKGAAAYYLIDGLEVGLEAESWLFNSPSQFRIGPQTRYILHFVPIVKPYAGVFYRHAFISDGFADLDSVGWRAGAFLTPTFNTFFGAGVVQEFYLDCDEDVYANCTLLYPEVTFSIAF